MTNRNINDLIYASENELWSVLNAATDQLDRRAAPHAWIAEAHAVGAKIITDRRTRLALSCEALQVSTEQTMQVSTAWLAQLRTEFLAVHAQRESLLQQVPQWQPMNTAPIDRRIMLKRPRYMGGMAMTMCVGIGRWEPQAHHKNPRPYWNDDRSFLSVAENRKSTPVGWMLIPV